MAEVAEHAGVSVMTVSRVLNGRPNVTPATRERVEASIAELGYRANLAARTLAGGRSRLICGNVPLSVGSGAPRRAPSARPTAPSDRFGAPNAASIGPKEILGARDRSFWLDGDLGGGVSWQRFIARLVAHGPVNEFVPGSLLQTAPTDYTMLGGVADDVTIDMA